MLLGYSLDVWATQLFIGLVNGCILILVAQGLSIVFGLMGIINFAHGIFYMLGAYAGWVTVRITGNFWLALVVAPLVVGAVGILVELGVLRRIYGTRNANFAGVLVTYGLAIMIPDVVRMIFGRPGKPFAVPSALTGSLFTFGGTDIGSYRIFIIGVTAVLLPLLWLLLNRTNLGMVIRAGTTDNLMVQLLGVNVARTWTITFALGAALAAFAGVITAPLIAVAPEMGGLILIECFIVTVVGGMGSFGGPIAGGLLIGSVLAITGMLYDVLADVVIYLLEQRGAFLAAALLLLAPLVADYTPFYLALLTEVLVFGLFALAYDILLGHTGVLSLGHSAFIGVAAYTTGILLSRWREIPVEMAVLAGAGGGLAVALLLGPLVLASVACTSRC